MKRSNVHAVNRQLDELMEVAGLHLAGALWEDDRLRLRLRAAAWDADDTGAAKGGDVDLVLEQVSRAHLQLAPSEAEITELVVDAESDIAHGLDSEAVLLLEQPLPRPASFFMELCVAIRDQSPLCPFDYLVGYLDLPHWLDHLLSTPCELVRGPMAVVRAASTLVAHQGCAHQVRHERAPGSTPKLLVSIDDSWVVCGRVHLEGVREVLC